TGPARSSARTGPAVPRAAPPPGARRRPDNCARASSHRRPRAPRGTSWAAPGSPTPEGGEGGFERRPGAEQGREDEACDGGKRQPGRYAIDAERLLQPATLLGGARTLAAGPTEVAEAGRPRSTYRYPGQPAVSARRGAHINQNGWEPEVLQRWVP